MTNWTDQGDIPPWTRGEVIFAVVCVIVFLSSPMWLHWVV